MQNNSLHEIFDKIRNNENEAIEELYKQFKDLIFSISYSLIKNKESSEDIVQNVYLKIVKMDKNLLPTNHEKSWIYAVTKNETINYIKKFNKEITVEEIYEISVEDDELTKIVDKDRYNRIMNCLNEEDKQIVSLKILGDMKFKEISELLRMPIGTVQWRYYKSLNTIKILIGNIAMFILSLSILLKRLIIGNNANNMSQELLEKNNEIAGTLLDFAEKNKISSGDITTIGLLSSTGIFLVLSIIFTIIFVKSKYTAKKK